MQQPFQVSLPGSDFEVEITLPVVQFLPLLPWQSLARKSFCAFVYAWESEKRATAISARWRNGIQSARIHRHLRVVPKRTCDLGGVLFLAGRSG
jgi:hypothetical protein